MPPLRRLVPLLAAAATAAALLPAGIATPASAAPDASATAQRPNWRAVPLTSPYPDYDSVSVDVQCIGSTCLVLGLVGSTSNGVPFLTTMSGHTPTTALITEKLGTIGRALSCPTADWCMAVGNVHLTKPADLTWAATYSSGTWKRRSTPTPSNGIGGQAYLNDVSCTSASWCAAVGWYFDTDFALQGLLLEWDGASWTRVETAQPGRFLRAIECPTARHCVIAGGHRTGGLLIRQWTPRGWFRVSGAPKVGDVESADISCETKDSCLITADRGAAAPPLILRTSGRTASSIDLPRGAEPVTALTGVSCDSTRTCFAVGTVDRADNTAAAAVVRISRADRVSLSTPYRAVRFASRLEAIDCDRRCVTVGQAVGQFFTLSPFALIQRPSPTR